MRLIIALFLLVLSPLAVAAEDKHGLIFLERFLKNTPAGLLEFRQKTRNAQGRLLSEGIGRLWFSQPFKYRLEYETPDYFLLVSDGERMYEYDKGLQQVIVRPFSEENFGGFITALAAGDINKLREHYTLYAGIGGDLRWAGADAISAENSVRRFRLGFDQDNGDLKQVEVVDAFDSSSIMHIYHIEKGAEEALFKFTPPPEADVVYE